MPRMNVIILGAGGRDFHNFNVYFRDNPEFNVVAFTATQIPNISNRTYPPSLAGRLYPNGIPILPQEELEKLIKEKKVEEAYLSYSDIECKEFMDIMSRVLSAGAKFSILSPEQTMIKSPKPVIAICASRTGAGKSTVSRYVSRFLKKLKTKFVVIRHPMAYGSFEPSWQRFEKYEDLEKYNCTIEEREEYEGHIKMGNIVYAGIDYGEILKHAVNEADIILWDGGNNDWPFYKPDIWITVVDPLRPGGEIESFPGGVNTRMADIIVVNKVNVAPKENIEKVVENVRKINPRAIIVKVASELSVDNPELIRGKKVLVVEDGPTVTHGHLSFAAGYIAAKEYGAKEIVDPRPYAIGSIREAFEKYQHIGPVLPALGYGEKQMKELEQVINKAEADVIVLGTPSDISRYLNLNKPVVRVSYEIKDVEVPSLRDVLYELMKERKILH
ncbi:MAG: GTPase [Thermoproteales archaeon]|nr:GTPase [Thermoproteales archaeon]